MTRTFRSGILAMNRAQLQRVARIYLEEQFAESSVGVLAGDEMFSQAEEALQESQIQVRRLGS